jgi:hypothetical protein
MGVLVTSFGMGQDGGVPAVGTDAPQQ